MSTPDPPASASDGLPRRRSARAWERPEPAPVGRPTRRAALLPEALRPLLRWLRRLPGRSLHPSTLRDRALVRRIHAALTAAPIHDDLTHVRVFVAHGRVTLAGRVATDDTRHALVRRVKAVRGVHEVDADGLYCGLQ